VLKHLNKTNLGRRISDVNIQYIRLLRLQKSTNDSALGIGVVLESTGPGLTSPSQEEQKRSRIRVWLKAIRTGCLECWEQRIKGADFWAW
jgi:hypothetical protein